MCWGDDDDHDFEPNTGWGGGYSQKLGKSFNSDEEYDTAWKEHHTSYGGEPDQDEYED